tara:strand:+ start:197 stop:580 length:384 start_codon:yes stop_codon:yes gene_type:complete
MTKYYHHFRFIMQPAPQQHPASIEINNQNQYVGQNQFGQQVVYTPTGQQVVIISQPPQNGLITASYICSAIGLLFGGIILGPIGFILGLVAKNNGDQRGQNAMIFGGVITGISILIFVFLISQMGSI